MSAIGNHEESHGQPVSAVGAAVILADKSDVHRSRVRNPDPATFDIHDRVNFAVEHSFLRVDERAKEITLELTINTEKAARDGVLRDLPVPHGDVPAGCGALGLRLQAADQRRPVPLGGLTGGGRGAILDPEPPWTSSAWAPATAPRL
jgi:hypothetical protein